VFGDDWPDLSPDQLAAQAETWLRPLLAGVRSLDDVRAEDAAGAVRALLPPALVGAFERLAPSRFLAPTGSALAIDYAADGGPLVTVRVQEMFGLDVHPSVADGRRRLTLALTSPAGRPLQVTRDLPAFWRGSWADVRREMRGRYPKHPWPAEPQTAAPTTRAKPRGT
jgi:ATP-dependent helicase HrpB